MSLTLFNQFYEDLHEEVHNFESDTFKLALIDNTSAPTAADAAPHWGGTGTTDHSANEVTAGGSYTANGDSLANTSSSQTSGTYTFDADDVSWAKNALSPTDAYFGILYNDTDANKRAIGYVTLSGPIDITAGALTVSWDASGIFTTS